MKTTLLLFLTIGFVGVLQAAPALTEEQALALLQSGGNAAAKEAACRRLKEIGSANAVAALQALLKDGSLAQWAVDALQMMPAREAGAALLQALPQVTAKSQMLIISALGIRQEAAAIPALTKLLGDLDPRVACAAARALGEIGGKPALGALVAASTNSTGDVRVAIDSALMELAEGFLHSGENSRAHSLYKTLYTPDKSPQVRAAAFRGLVLSGDGVSAVVSALSGVDEIEQVTAVQFVRELPGASATKAFAKALPQLAPRVQVAVLEGLRQRGEAAAATSVAVLVDNGDAAVRVSALRALGELGNASHVALLGDRAASGTASERAEALQALITLHRGDVTGAILSEISRARLEVKLELLQALARRQDRGAVRSLLRFAAGDDARIGVASLRTLEKLASVSHMPALLDLSIRAKDEVRRDAAVAAFVTVGGRSRKPSDFTELALKAIAGAKPEVRCALLEAAGQLGGADVVPALRLGLKDANDDIRATASRVMAEYAGDEARPDLLKLAQESKSETARALALRGYWRLVEGMSSRGQSERFAAVQAGLAVPGLVAADKKLGLARLSELQSRQALEAALRYREEQAVCAEAESACLAIASRLEGADLEAAEQVLVALAGSASVEHIRNEAKAVLAKREDRKGYIVPWLVSGPYRQQGKEAQQLFDVSFLPEPTERTKAPWRALPGEGPTLDLLPVAGGDHCVVYLKTRVFCPQAQPVALEIGTDDGVKLWINGALVHANNAVRGFTAGQDKARATLKEGWNDFLVKVTQHTAGCAASVRVRTPDGKAIPGLRIEAEE